MSKRSLGWGRRARLALVGALAAVSVTAWTASAVALQKPPLPTVMAGSNSKGRTIFSIKPRSIVVYAYYKHVPTGYPRDEHTMFYGKLVKLKWSSWTATRGTATGTLISEPNLKRVRASVVVSHPRGGIFRQLSVKCRPNLYSFSTPVYDASQDLWTGTI